MTKFPIGDLFKRPEALTLAVAVIVAGLAATGIPARLGLAIPESEIGLIVSIFLAVFVGAVFEGKYKGVDYAGGLKQLWSSTKFRMACLALVGMVVNAVLEPLGYSLPDEAVLKLGEFVLLFIGGAAGLDGFRAAKA